MRTSALPLLLSFAALSHARGNRHGALLRRQEPTPGSTIYPNAPACTYYRCHISYNTGDVVTVNWLNAEQNGNVLIALMSEDGSQLKYNLTTAPPTLDTNFCDSDEGLGVKVDGRTCGRVEFKLPSFVDTGNYTLRTSTLPPAAYHEEFTDILTIKKTADNVPMKLLPLKGANGATYTPSGSAYSALSSSAPAAGAAPSTPAPPPAGTTGASGASSAPVSAATTTTPAPAANATSTTTKPPASSSTSGTPSGGNLAVSSGALPLAVSLGSALAIAALCLA